MAPTLDIRKLNLANKITLGRIVAIVPIVLLLNFPTPLTCWIAAILFIIASLSDMLDGYVARREGQVTNFGKFLDPLADKLLICSVLVELVGLGWVPSWVAIVILMREMAVTGLRAVAADKGIVIAADWYGKWKTLLQLLALVPLVLHFPVLGFDPNILGLILLYTAVLLTIGSGVNYFYRFYTDWTNAQHASGQH